MSSLQERLAARRAKWFTGDEEVPVPGYGGELVARYGRANWSALAPLVLGMAEEPSAKDVEAAARLLVQSSTGVDAHVDGKVAPVTNGDGPVKMGLPLARFLDPDGMDGIDTDVQAVFMIFPSDVAIMEHVSALRARQSAREDRADEDLAGN